MTLTSKSEDLGFSHLYHRCIYWDTEEQHVCSWIVVLWPCADTDLRWMSPLQLGRDRTRSSWRRRERGRKSAATSSGRAATPPSARKEHQHSWRWSWMKSVEHRYNKSVWKTKFAWNINLFPAFLSLQFHFVGAWLLWHLFFFSL